MIFRLSHNLSAKIKVSASGALPLHENPLADWSAQWFLAARRPYILLCNTKALIATVFSAKGITNERHFVEQSLSNIKELIQAEGKDEVYARSIVPETGSIRFAKVLNRSITGSMNDMVKHVTYWLAQGDISLQEIGVRLSETPMSALKSPGSPYGFPRNVFKAVVANEDEERGVRHGPGGRLRGRTAKAVATTEGGDAGKVIQHVNRKGDTYYLHKGQTKTGKLKWYFSMRTDGELVESIPDGYEIYENYMAQVFLRTIVPTLVTKAEIEQVERGVRELANVKYFLVEGKADSITVFLANQEAGFLEGMLARKFGLADREGFSTAMLKHLTYLPHMRFTLIDEKRRRFTVDRWCFLGSIDNWFPLRGSGDLAKMVKQYAPHLGQESFYELM
jgi:hypothetical protein